MEEAPVCEKHGTMVADDEMGRSWRCAVCAPAVGASLPVRRYDLVQVNHCYTTDHEMELCEAGDYVRYEDVQAALLELKTEMEQHWRSRTFADALTVKAWVDTLGALLQETQTR